MTEAYEATAWVMPTDQPVVHQFGMSQVTESAPLLIRTQDHGAKGRLVEPGPGQQGNVLSVEGGQHVDVDGPLALVECHSELMVRRVLTHDPDRVLRHVDARFQCRRSTRAADGPPSSDAGAVVRVVRIRAPVLVAEEPVVADLIFVTPCLRRAGEVVPMVSATSRDAGFQIPV